MSKVAQIDICNFATFSPRRESPQVSLNSYIIIFNKLFLRTVNRQVRAHGIVALS
ncbi:MAG: hypothetical protein CLLPBCKN_008497 [Chroococcidiopsis cubana SAG 39.79]|nr:hypothetical protein [Chroococcidiopsis cubana SAG 39.79]